MPKDVQMPPVAPLPTEPPSPAVLCVAQMVWSPPALADAAERIVTTTCAVAPAQGRAVNVSVTVPAVLSAAVGV